MKAHHRQEREPPNAILRGGPLDGETVTVRTMRAGIEREVDGQIYTYVPTPEMDDEFPTMAVFIYAGERPALWLAGGLVG
jgi:hypothetical protein